VFAQAVLLLLDALSLPPLLLVVCSIWRVPTLVCATQIVLDTTSEGDSSHAGRKVIQCRSQSRRA
jgi:hypothetical protein